MEAEDEASEVDVAEKLMKRNEKITYVIRNKSI